MLARTFLRLTALEAVRPSALLASDGPWPTMAASYWFDSRLDPIEGMGENERRPVGCIYTEDDTQEKISQAGPIFYASSVSLVFEISVEAVGRDGDTGDFIAGTAYTDAELEASLDALENQIWHALHFAPSGALFRAVAKMPALRWQSHPMRSSEESGRLAARTIKAQFDIKEVCYQAVPTAPPTGLDRLPPALKKIALALDGSTYLAKIIAGVAGAAPVAPVRVPLTGVGVTVDRREQVAAPIDSEAVISASIDNLQG